MELRAPLSGVVAFSTSADETWLGVSWASGREVAGTVDLARNGDEDGSVWRWDWDWNGRAQSRLGSVESMFYFRDVDGDGRRDVVINQRLCLQVKDDQYRFENRKLAYRILENGKGFAPIQLSPEKLMEAVRSCKSDPDVPYLIRGAMLPELQDKSGFGEAIFPAEAKYEDTALPTATGPWPVAKLERVEKRKK